MLTAITLSLIGAASAVPLTSNSGSILGTPTEQVAVKLLHNVESGECQMLSHEPGFHRLANDGVHEARRPSVSAEHSQVGSEDYVELFGSFDAVDEHLGSMCSNVFGIVETESSAVQDEVIEIVKTGDPSNRIDVVFMGDGYDATEREAFLEDMTRLKDDMWGDTTFETYLPLFNVWAVYRPSTDSGIGVGGRPLDTAFGLYRDGTELRGIYCSKPNAARDACKSTGPNACDFPSLIGNDDYYGGLGGEFAISTKSETSGTVVLRHEFGHNFGNVGEEYDGGSVYSGANSAPNLDVAKNKWGVWLSDAAEFKSEESQIRVQDYAWYDLAKGPYKIDFESDGKYNKWFMRFTASGVEYDDTFQVSLDGEVLEWHSHGNLDRGFHEYLVLEGLSAGPHQLVFEQLKPPTSEMIRQLCSITLIEYKDEPDFHFGDEFTGAYRTWNVYNKMIGYRPNNERCLMRNMTSTAFCDVCVENMWLQFFARMRVIDDVEVENDGTMTHFHLSLVPLADLRDTPREGEKYHVEWTHNGRPVVMLQDKYDFVLPSLEAAGSWSVTARFETPEVRQDPNNLLEATEIFMV
eukprot:Rmarinus@m.20450